MANNQFYVDLQSGKTPEETCSRLVTQVVLLVQQLNQAGLPIVVGPNDPLPESVNVGQTVINWSSGNSVVGTWNGEAYV